MATAMGWFGPLIDISAAASHVGDFVQLLVFVHRSNPVQYKLAKGGTVIRVDIHVGDDTRPFFSVSIWDKHLASSVSAGDIILLQNVKVMTFGSSVEARTVQYSSILRLIHPYDSLLSKGLDELMGSCRVVGNAREKLRKVIEWVKRTRSTLCCSKLKGDQGSALQNWKVLEEQNVWLCSLVSEVLKIASSCKVTFHASVGEIFLLSEWQEREKERMFITRQLVNRVDNLVEDMICTGCHICGSPLSSETELKAELLFCKSSSNRLHTVGLIYRPFMLYVWDDSDYIPLLVTNKAAEILFGNIRAEKVYHSQKEQKNHRQSLQSLFREAADVHELKTNEGEVTELCSFKGDTRSEKGKDHAVIKPPNFYLIWLILLKFLLVQGKNSPLKFEALVNPSLEMEDGRYEMIRVWMPYLEHHAASSSTKEGKII